MTERLDKLLGNPSSISKVVCITFCGRSGSYLLSNLLDGHSNTLSLPPHAAINIIDVLASCGSKGESATAIATHIAQGLPYLFNDADHSAPLGDTTTAVGVSREEFIAVYQSGLIRANACGPITIGTLFRLVFIAYAVCLKRDVSTIDPVIVWQKHVPIERAMRPAVENIIGGEVFFITCVRRPEVSLAAHIAHHMKEKPINHLHSVFSQMFDAMIMAAEKSEDVAHEYAVRFEDCHQNTRKTMESICRLIGIDFEEILLQTTLDGELFYFTKNGKKITGTSPERAASKKTPLMNALDRIRIQMVMRPIYSAWGYPASSRGAGITQRFKFISDFIFKVPMWAEALGFMMEIRNIYKEALDRSRKNRSKMAEVRARKEDSFIQLLEIDPPEK
jgi:hypothetical protein